MNAPNLERLAFAATRAERVKEIITPEGVPLYFGVGRIGDRIAALLLDGAVILAAAAIIGLGCLAGASAFGASTWQFFIAALTVTFFGLRVFYFTWHELRKNGSTPGKRRMGLRVIDAHGGQLKSEAILARNFLREIELWLPLQALLGAKMIFPTVSGWAALLAVIWILALAVIPLLNADRRRAGDFVAGTMVAVLPQGRLLRDLGRPSSHRPHGAFERTRYTFTHAHLGIYGIYELEVLEEVLRAKGRDRRKALATVAQKIQLKIGWDPHQPAVDPEPFLRDFYRAQRKHLEQKMLLGARKERKSGSEDRD